MFKPINILLFLVSTIGLYLLYFTVMSSKSIPTQYENLYFDNYKNVENKFAQIQEDKKEFDKNYKFHFNIEDNKVVGFYIVRNDNNKNVKFNAKCKITKTYTNKYNQNLDVKFANNKYYVNIPSKLPENNWRVMLKINIDNLTIYKNINI